MPVFLLFYALLYGSLHAWCVWYARRAFPGARGRRRPLTLVLVLWSVLMIAAPVGARLFERAGWEAPARYVALVAFCWSVWLFWFCCLSALGVLWNGGARAARRLSRGRLRPPALPPRRLCVAALVIISGASVYGLFEASHVRLRKVDVVVERLPADMPPLRILQTSDMHLSVAPRPDVVAKMARIVAETRPDLVVDTGDLVDAPPELLAGEIERLAAIRAPLGKFSVFGNHEGYMGAELSRRFHEDAGFHLLRDETFEIQGRLLLVGLDDPAARSTDPPDPENLLPSGRPADVPVVVLNHRPLVDGLSAGTFDLQISGHTHDGQVFPFGWVVRMQYPRIQGLYEIGGGARLFVSRGTGVWGPPMRVFAPPEAVLYTIRGGGGR